MKASALLASVVAFALAGVLTGCGSGNATTTPETRTVGATGTGTVKVAPDTVNLGFGHETSAPDAKTALAKASRVASDITNALVESGVKREDIQTAAVNLYPTTEQRADKVKVTRYRASISVSVTLDKVDTAGDVIQAATDAGATSISGPWFSLSPESPANDQALTAAIEDARAKAQVMAAAVGAKVGRVVSIIHGSTPRPPQYGIGLTFDGAPQGRVPIEAGQVDATAEATVIFELE